VLKPIILLYKSTAATSYTPLSPHIMLDGTPSSGGNKNQSQSHAPLASRPPPDPKIDHKLSNLLPLANIQYLSQGNARSPCFDIMHTRYIGKNLLLNTVFYWPYNA
jgi:hypothetical protein